MATNGTSSIRLFDKYSGEEGADLIFDWEVINQSAINNTTTIKYSLRLTLDYENTKIYTTYRNVRINGANLYLSRKDLNFFGINGLDESISSGTYTIEHDIEGNGNFSFYNEVWNNYIYNPDRGGTTNFVAVLQGNEELPKIDRAAQILTASNFTDIENPSFTFQAGGSDLSKLEVGLSLDGETADVVGFTNVSTNSSSYTFELTEAQREYLRTEVQGSDTVPIYYMLRTTHTRDSVSITNIAKANRTITIVGANPIITVATAKDIKPETLALTGDENTIVENESMVEYAFEAVASKHATIDTKYVQCGSKKIENMTNGVIDDAESATVIFYVSDSRGMAAQSSVFKKAVPYIKPTCYQKIDIELSGETSANIKLVVNGNWFPGSFGLSTNRMKIEVRHTDDNGTMGAWQVLSGITFNGNSYSLEKTFTGFDYGKSYVFQCRATDLLNVVQSSQYTVRVLPVFDWGDSDFNFNVPVNINAEELSMHGETILRHSDTTNNTVLSASNGNIYVRPGGTNSTSGETIFYSNGNVKFNGTVIFADGSTGGGSAADADYVIEIGEEAMGTNGTWYWRKWNSGKSEAWGCRNFGNAAVTTAWGNLYRSAIFTQDLPDDVFIRTPDVISINIVHSNYGGWICKHEQTAPSAITTGSFIFVRPASATVSPTNIGFYIAGEWK